MIRPTRFARCLIAIAISATAMRVPQYGWQPVAKCHMALDHSYALVARVVAQVLEQDFPA